jgi:hypothetical protein
LSRHGVFRFRVRPAEGCTGVVRIKGGKQAADYFLAEIPPF